VAPLTLRKPQPGLRGRVSPDQSLSPGWISFRAAYLFIFSTRTFLLPLPAAILTETWENRFGNSESNDVSPSRHLHLENFAPATLAHSIEKARIRCWKTGGGQCVTQIWTQGHPPWRTPVSQVRSMASHLLSAHALHSSGMRKNI
jgi:hypothetical protein